MIVALIVLKLLIPVGVIALLTVPAIVERLPAWYYRLLAAVLAPLPIRQALAPLILRWSSQERAEHLAREVYWQWVWSDAQRLDRYVDLALCGYDLHAQALGWWDE